MSWIFGNSNKKNAKRSNGVEQANSSGLLPQSLRDLLKLFDAENIVLGNGDVVLEYSEGVSTLNIRIMNSCFDLFAQPADQENLRKSQWNYHVVQLGRELTIY
jgi:hypothetical protein